MSKSGLSERKSWTPCCEGNRPVMRLVLAGEHTGFGLVAFSIRNARVRQPVESRRLDLLIAVGPGGPLTVVVGEEQDDVRVDGSAPVRIFPVEIRRPISRLPIE